MKTSYGKVVTWLVVLCAAFLLFAPMRYAREDRLMLSAEEIELSPGEVFALHYKLEAQTTQTVAFSSSNLAIADVNGRGEVTGVAPGTAVIQALAQGGARAQANVTVTGEVQTAILLNTDRLEMNKGEVSGLTCTTPDGEMPTSLVWASDDTRVATVDAAGRVKAVGAGETCIRAYAAGGLTAQADVFVSVYSTAVMIAPANVHVGVGSSFRLETDYYPEDSTDAPAKWKSSNPAVLTVDETGKARALSVGTATVTVETVQGQTGETTVEVEPASEGFAISLTELTMERGQWQALEAWLIAENGAADLSSDHHIEWESASPDVAAVENGVVRALRSGSSVISASADGYRATCRVRVETHVHTVIIEEEEVYLLPDQTDAPIALHVRVEPEDADDTRLQYRSDNPVVATVTEDGIVEFTGAYGTARIVASADGGAQAEVSFHVVSRLPEAEEEASPEM